MAYQSKKKKLFRVSLNENVDFLYFANTPAEAVSLLLLGDSRERHIESIHVKEVIGKLMNGPEDAEVHRL